MLLSNTVAVLIYEGRFTLAAAFVVRIAMVNVKDIH